MDLLHERPKLDHYWKLKCWLLWQITADRLAYHCADYIYPVGFCSTRLYASLSDPTQKCLYTCKIAEGHDQPEVSIQCVESKFLKTEQC